MQETAPRPLRPHQTEAVEAILRGLDIPPGKCIPEAGLRVNVVSACGTGKTMMAAHTALRIAPRGRVLVLLPTLDLLTQTIREWRAAGHNGPAVAVCSLDDDPELFAAGVRTTTNPIELALRHGEGPITVYATYASLPVIAEAAEGAFGQRLMPFHLAVVDEAHRTSGHMGKAWAAIHDNGVIPCERRLYMTATPRIWQERPATWRPSGRDAQDRLPEELACSMDDTSIYGPCVFRLTLADAIAAGLLARYQIVVVELTDPELPPDRLYGPEKREEEVRGLRLGALQAAMIRTATEHNLRSMITFHHRTMEAEAFAEGLPGVVRKLNAADPERYPAHVWSGWLHGEHESDHRRMVLGEFATHTSLAILSNCKVLGEGVDIRAVDSVALLDPKGSAVDIVQAIGRALRQMPGEGKVATLIVPVFLKAGEKVKDMATSASYRPLVKVLRGLKAHDEQAVEMLAIPTTDSQSAGPERIGFAPEEGEEESRALLRFSTPRDPVVIADMVAFQVLSTERQDWYRGYAAARTYAHREGHLVVPYEHREVEGEFPLGQWIGRQRAAYRAGELTGERARRLEALGMVWSPGDIQFEESLAAARVVFAEWETLCVPRAVTALGRPVGQWLTNCRRPGGLGADPERAARRGRQLAAVDPEWCPGWAVDWQRLYVALRGLLAGGAALGDVVPGVTVRGEDVGRWLDRQTRPEVWGTLTGGQQGLLTALSVAPRDPDPVPATAVPAQAAGPGRGAAAWEAGLAALAAYREREGHTRVPRGHVEVVDGQEVRLGVWRANQRTRRAKLPAARVQQLAELGMWD